MSDVIFPEPADQELLKSPPPPLRGLILKEKPGPLALTPGTALVRYTPTGPRTPLPRSLPLRLELLAMWGLVVVGLYLLFQATGYQRAIRDLYSNQDRSIGSLGKVLRSEDNRLNGVTGDVEKMNHQINAWAGNTNTHLMDLDEKLSAQDRATRALMDKVKRLEGNSPAQSSKSQPRDPDHMQSAMLMPLPLQGPSVDHSQPASPQNPHAHAVNIGIPPIAGAVVHTNAMGQQDYWLVTRSLNSKSHRRLIVRVLPLEVTSRGVKVHSIEDGLDYTLTSSGEWLPN